MQNKRFPKTIWSVSGKKCFYFTKVKLPRRRQLHKILYADGYVTEPLKVMYEYLVAIFGQPTSNGDQYYNDAEWIVLTPEGLSMIHNHKNGQTFCGRNGTPTEDITDWIIRGETYLAIQWIKEALADDQR